MNRILWRHSLGMLEAYSGTGTTCAAELEADKCLRLPSMGIRFSPCCYTFTGFGFGTSLEYR